MGTSRPHDLLGDEPVFVTEQDALTLVPPGAWWAVAWWIDHPELDVYVNINTPATCTEDRIVAVDLDLDVVRWRDGRVEVIDRDEFDANRVRYRYPAAVVAGVDRAAAEVVRALTANEPPFDGAAAKASSARARRDTLD